MTETPQHSTTDIVRETHKEWQELYGGATSGKKALLTQMRNHYARIIQASPDAAAELLAMYDYTKNMDLSVE